MARNPERNFPELTAQIVIPAPGIQSVRNPNPTQLSPPPFLGGWGAPVLKQERVEAGVQVHEPEVIRVETLSASGYLTLVESEYRSSEDLQRRIPFSFFQYYMVQVWWRKTLQIKEEVRRLNADENDALRALEALGDVPLTGRLADYFRVFSSDRYSGIGNVSFSFSGSIGVNGFGGFPSSSENSVRVDSSLMWIYALFPIPGVALSALFRDFIRATSSGGDDYECFSDIRPVADFFPGSDCVLETGNILCWRETGLLLDLQLVRSLFSELNMSRVEDIPKGFEDQSTNWLVSPSVMSVVAGAIEETNLGVVGIESLSQLANWHEYTESYIRVRQTRESVDTLIEAPSFWNAYSCGVSTIQSEHPVGPSAIPFLVLSGFGAEITFGDDGTTNHSPWYGVRQGVIHTRGPSREQLLSCSSLLLSWRSGQGTYPTFHTEAVKRLEYGRNLSVNNTS